MNPRPLLALSIALASTGCGNFTRKTLAHAGVASCRTALQPTPQESTDRFANLAKGRTFNQVVVSIDGREGCAIVDEARETVAGALGCARTEMDADPVRHPDELIIGIRVYAHSPTDKGFTGVGVGHKTEPLSPNKELNACLSELTTTLQGKLTRKYEDHTFSKEDLAEISIRVSTSPSKEITTARNSQNAAKTAVSAMATDLKKEEQDAAQAKAKAAAEAERARVIEACKAGVIKQSDFAAQKDPAWGAGYCVELSALTVQMTSQTAGLFKISGTEKIAWVELGAPFKEMGFTALARIEGAHRYPSANGDSKTVTGLRVLRLTKVGLPD